MGVVHGQLGLIPCHLITAYSGVVSYIDQVVG